MGCQYYTFNFDVHPYDNTQTKRLQPNPAQRDGHERESADAC